MNRRFDRLCYLINWLFGKCKTGHTKCEKCNLNGIHQILWHDLPVYKCDECGYVRLKTDEMLKLANNITIANNVGNIKRLNNISEMAAKEVAKIERIATFHRDGVKVKKEISTTEPKNVCDFCGTDLAKFFCKNGFTYYYCPYCGSFYFLQKDYDEVIKKYV